MSFNEDVKLKAQSALKSYLTEDNPLHDKNPILLLNYLHQHAIISSPRYFVTGIQNHSQHAVSCQIDDLRVIGNGKTNKIAKTNAAQQILELLLKPVYMSSVHSSLSSVTSLATLAPSTSDVYTSVSCRYVTNDSENRLSSLYPDAGYQVENFISNRINEANSLACLVESQSNEDKIAKIHFQRNVFPEEVVMDTFETRNRGSVSKFQITSPFVKVEEKSNYDSGKLSEDSFQRVSPVAHQISNCNDFFDPFKTVTSKTRNRVSLSTFQIAFPQSAQPSKGPYDHELQLNPAAVSREQPRCDDFFDPFFKQRPSNSNSASVMETNDTENHIQKQANQSKCTNNIPDVTENKNVFALLQKKTQKHLKLIPRFRIESIESGFQCNVRIGSYYASAEGKNKKEAKTKAAIHLLNQIKDLN